MALLQSKKKKKKKKRKKKIIDNKKSLSVFHNNAYPLSKSFDDLEHLLKCTEKRLI